jgi:xylono-1,5-lactonase
VRRDLTILRCVVNPGCTLGEGPVWDAESQRLYWVDIVERRIYRYGPEHGTTETWVAPEQVAFVVPEADGALLAGFASGLHRVELRADGSVDAERIDRVATDGGLRLNDVARDAEGRLWVCTLGGTDAEPLGVYYRYDEALTSRVVDRGYLVANGPALSPDERLLYTVETRGHRSRRRGVFVSRVTPSGELAEQRLLIDWAPRESQPDGLVTDADGCLWIGEFEGNALRRFSPDGEELETIPLPAWNPTKPAFAGDDTLYVTTARFGVDEEALARYPDTGGVIEISALGSSS